MIYNSNSTGPFKILQRNGDACLIQFIDTGTTKTACISNILAGKVKDQYFPTVYGKGYYGDYDKTTTYYKQAKQLWQNMLKRCYCEKDLKGYYGKATVSQRWLNFSNFLEDLPSLVNFKQWLAGQQKTGGKYNLDKDLKVKGNTCYCKEACMFVTEFENKSEGAKNGKPYTKMGKS